jgi:hypothetical protein
MKIIDIAEAERMAGRRLDRRRNYATTEDGKPDEWYGGALLFELGEWTESCSGCRETEDGHNVGHYPWDDKAKCYIGGGCSECGFTGKRRQREWLPVCDKASLE